MAAELIKIQKTFIISLESRFEDRLLPLIERLADIGFDVSPFFVYKAISNDNGGMGLIQTIKNLFEECLAKGLKTIMVFEDDVEFIRSDVNEQINKCLTELPMDFDLLFLGCNLWQNVVYKHSHSLVQLYDAYALQSVIYSESGMRKVLKAINEMESYVPLDVLIQQNIMKDGKVFCSFPALTSQKISYSNIEKKEVNYFDILQKRFSERTKHLI